MKQNSQIGSCSARNIVHAVLNSLKGLQGKGK